MLNLITRITFIAILFLTPLALKAQNRTRIDIGAEFGLPSGNFSSLSGIGLGASVKASFPVTENLALTVNGGFMHFFGKRNQIFKVQDLGYVQAKAGLKYQLGESFYAEGQVGAATALKQWTKNFICMVARNWKSV